MRGKKRTVRKCPSRRIIPEKPVNFNYFLKEVIEERQAIIMKSSAGIYTPVMAMMN
jgi:hypothetical protein